MRNKKSTDMFRIALTIVNVVKNIFTEHLKITFQVFDISKTCSNLKSE